MRGDRDSRLLAVCSEHHRHSMQVKSSITSQQYHVFNEVTNSNRKSTTAAHLTRQNATIVILLELTEAVLIAGTQRFGCEPQIIHNGYINQT